MRIIEAKEILTALGWQVRRGGGVSFDAEYQLQDRFVSMIPKIMRLVNREELVYDIALSTNEFMEACQYISGKKIFTR